MTALAGIFLRDGRPVDRKRLTAVADSLRPFGAGVPTMWRGGPAGLVKTVSVVATPQDEFDSQPMAQGSVKLANQRRRSTLIALSNYRGPLLVSLRGEVPRAGKLE